MVNYCRNCRNNETQTKRTLNQSLSWNKTTLNFLTNYCSEIGIFEKIIVIPLYQIKVS